MVAGPGRVPSSGVGASPSLIDQAALRQVIDASMRCQSPRWTERWAGSADDLLLVVPLSEDCHVSRRTTAWFGKVPTSQSGVWSPC